MGLAAIAGWRSCEALIPPEATVTVHLVLGTIPSAPHRVQTTKSTDSRGVKPVVHWSCAHSAIDYLSRDTMFFVILVQV